jgi:hypothetical protein
MNERYSRLFVLPANLYVEGSPVLIAAGALLKDNYANKVLVQLKFRNISQKAIKSVKVKVNAYDTAKGQLAGIDAFSYLDLSVAENEEFGQNTPIHLPDITTRSFAVEILSVVYADSEVFIPKDVSAVGKAPKEIIEGVQRIEAEKQAEREALEKQEMMKRKQFHKQLWWIVTVGVVPVLFVLLSVIIHAYRDSNLFWTGSYIYSSFGETFEELIRDNSARYVLALFVPCLFVLAAFIGKKKPVVVKAALIIGVTLLVLKIVAILIYGEVLYSDEWVNLRLWLLKYVNCVELGWDLDRLLFYLGHGATWEEIGLRHYFLRMVADFFAVLPNIFCTTALAIYSKKMK